MRFFENSKKYVPIQILLREGVWGQSEVGKSVLKTNALERQNMKRSRNRVQKTHSYNSLEERRLLAGDVTLVQAEDVAYLRGDRADNNVVITATDDGQVVIRGVGETTINGEAEVVLDSENSTIGRLGIHMGKGNDTLVVHGIDVERRAIVFGGTGDDAIGFYDVNTGSDLIANPWLGNDAISLDGVDVGGRLVAYTGAGDDIVGIDNSTIHGRTLIGTGFGNDRLALQDTTHNGEVFAFTGPGNDFFSVDNMAADKFTALVSGYGDDDVVVTNSQFNRFAFANGRDGVDNLQRSGNQFNGENRQRNFEGETVEDAEERRDAIFADLIDLDIKPGSAS